MKKLKIFLIVLLVLIVAAIGGSVYGAYQVSGLDTIYPNITIDNVDVGEMTREQAIQVLNQSGWETRAKTLLEVSTVTGESFTVDPLLAGVAPKAEDYVEIAYAFGRDGNILENFVSYAKCFVGGASLSSAGQSPDRTYIGEFVDKALAAVEENLGTEPYTVDAENSQLLLTKGVGELTIDRDAFIDAIVDSLKKADTKLDYITLAKELTCPDFQAIHDELKKEPKDAYLTDDGTFTVVDEIIGCEFDVEKAKQDWANCRPGDELTVPLTITRPEITGDSLRDQLFGTLLGACTTYYPNSGPDRRSNLRLATSKIDGLIMYPGDLFAYNTVVGERTEAAGFKPAPAYVNGEEKDEIGGGACQVSSTLYSATLFAFLETVERENHYFAVNYLQLGTDATVTIPTDGGRAIDFKFRNSRSTPIKIVGYCNDEESSITFEIWGMLGDDDFQPIQFDNTYKGQFPSDRIVEKVDPNREGFKIQLTHETYSFTDEVGSGYRTVTWRKVFNESGECVLEEMTNLLNDYGKHTMDTYYFHEH